MKWCCNCDKELTKDEIGISKKMLGRNIINFFCIDCLAEYLECTPEEITDKIEQFKEEGCKLFG